MVSLWLFFNTEYFGTDIADNLEWIDPSFSSGLTTVPLDTVIDSFAILECVIYYHHVANICAALHWKHKGLPLPSSAKH